MMSLLISHVGTGSRVKEFNHAQSHSTSNPTPFILSTKRSATLPLAFSSPAVMSAGEWKQEKKQYQVKAQNLSCINNSDIKDYVLEKVHSVNAALDKAVLFREPLKLHESMRYSLLDAGRKPAYAVLCIASCELMGGREAAAMPAACALEMMHTAFSILADLPSMNNNFLRWGKATNHEVFGEDIAILAANALLALAFQHVATATKGVAYERILRVVAELAQCMGSEGLAYEHLISVEKPCGVVLKPYFEFLNNDDLHKPAALLEACLVIGAIVGGANDQQVSELMDFSLSINPLFQVNLDEESVMGYITK